MLACGGILAGVLAMAGLPGASASGPAPAARAAGAACVDPVVHDRYDGFHVGVPRGWDLSSAGGLIVVSKDYTDRDEGFVQTAYAGAGESGTGFLSKVLSALSRRVTVGSEALSFHLTGATTASLSGHVGAVPIAGAASVSFVTSAGRHGSRIGVVSGYWAPAGAPRAERAVLASIGACYGPEPGSLYRFYNDGTFAYVLPPGWKRASENADLLFLDAGPDASASFLFVGPFTPAQGVTDGPSLARYTLQQFGITIDRVLTSLAGPTQTTANGLSQQEVIIAFRGHLAQQGGSPKPLRGVVRVISDTGGGGTTGTLRVALAAPALWNSLNGALQWVMFSIEHNFTQDLQAIQQAQEQMAGFAQQVAGFDQVLNGTDLVRDPSTGIQYEAPYSAWQNNGPNGAGYYIGNPGAERKLTPIAPR